MHASGSTTICMGRKLDDSDFCTNQSIYHTMTLLTNQSESNSSSENGTGSDAHVDISLSRYRLFEIANSQGNQWKEAFFEVEPTQNKFQLIFEATGSNGLINDIAIDDVALLNGGDCLKFSKNKTTDETDGIFGIQSCANRCNETESMRTNGNTTLSQNGKIIEKCDCHLECLDLDTCCVDYQLKCPESEIYRFWFSLLSFKPNIFE